MPLLPDPPTNPLVQLHHPGAQFRYRPLHPIIPGNNRNKSNNTKSNRETHLQKTQLTHHINNWKEDRAKILKTTINNLKDNINPPKKNDTLNQTISNILDNAYETIKNTIINYLNNELSK
ncbi:hypothetical protein HELRODRAFT_180020 [Helobdella robusta]|uniref:Uncharacterized protein n=1 Tax=Helobdella robusta TaxID=6412 RepID=T1FFC8_HELRO|nr:hypothetical protein HELRODRAFT_180020 [Helobdella robusta]ESN94913.1 hypothetical protein HELRODRAFT_180020 [Helobdella robusta]